MGLVCREAQISVVRQSGLALALWALAGCHLFAHIRLPHHSDDEEDDDDGEDDGDSHRNWPGLSD